MIDQPYFPESDYELDRLESKTDRESVVEQSTWAGLKPGMRVLDVGCGPGVTTAFLASVVGTGGAAVGVDRSSERIEHANKTYGSDNVKFDCRNFFDDLSDLGQFDFVWIRFVLEYFRDGAFKLVENAAKALKPGGVLCLVDLDHNCLNHYGLSERLERSILKIADIQMEKNNFDPYAGRKLPSHIHDLNFSDLRVDVRTHHLVYGDLTEGNRTNWWYKFELASRNSGWTFEDYDDGFAGFEREFKEYFMNPRRFAYTPMILARGVKPQAP